jgi:mono/diheme cytochrome c family protein
MKNTKTLLAVLTIIATSQVRAQVVPPASFALCAACHGMDGKGLLAGTPTPMAPPLAGSRFVAAGDGEVMASIVFTGIAKEDAKYLGLMAPLGPAMTDVQMAEVLTYVRSSFGNTAPAVTAEQLKLWREKYNGKPMQKRADLEKLVSVEPATKP